MNKIKIYGIGGQGVVTASKFICTAVCIYENKYAKTTPSYGHERRGAPVFSDVFIDDNPILLNTFVTTPDIVLLFDPFILSKGVDIRKGIHKDTILIVNSAEVDTFRDYGFKYVYYVDATKISIKNSGRNIPNVPMFGAFANTGIVSIDNIIKCGSDFFGNENFSIIKESIEEAYYETKRI